MAFRIQLRRDTSANWALNNPILLSGEIGYETNTTYIKIGDGTTPWNDLPYWTGGVTGAGLAVKEGSITVQSPTNNLNFNQDDFVVTSSFNNTANVSLAAGGPGGAVISSVRGTDGTGITGATGLFFPDSRVTGSGKVATVQPVYVAYFQVTAQLSGANFASFSSSRGPDGEPLTGPSWNFAFSNSGNNLTITHNTGCRPINLAAHGKNGSILFIRPPVGTSNSQFALESNDSFNAFTVYQVNATNTGAAVSSTIDLIWQFGATL